MGTHVYNTHDQLETMSHDLEVANEDWINMVNWKWTFGESL